MPNKYRFELPHFIKKQAQSDLWAATIYKLMHPNENYTYWATNVCLLAWACGCVCRGIDGLACARAWECVHARVCVRACASVCAASIVRARVCVHECASTSVHSRVWVDDYLWTSVRSKCSCMSVCAWVSVNACDCVSMCAEVCDRLRLYISSCMRLRAHVHKFVFARECAYARLCSQ